MRKTTELGRRRATLDRLTDAIPILDQGTLSALNFATSVLVGQSAGPRELGLFTVAITATVMVAVACDAFVGTTFMARRWQIPDHALRQATGSVVMLQSAAAAIAALLCGLGAVGCLVVIGDRTTASVLAALMLMIPAILIRELARRISLAEGRPRDALLTTLITAATQIPLLVLFSLWHNLDAPTALWIIALACSISAALWILRQSFDFDLPAARTYLAQNWRESFWTFAALGSLLAQLFVVIWALGVLSTGVTVGRFAACQVLATLPNPLLTGLSNVIMPRAAVAYATSGTPGVRRLTLRVATPLSLIMAVAVGPILVFGGTLVELLYGASFEGLGSVVAILAAAFLLRAVAMSPYIGLWALGHSRLNFLINCLGIVVTIAALPWLYRTFGIEGAAMAALLGDLVAASTRSGAFMRVLSNRRPAARDRVDE